MQAVWNGTVIAEADKNDLIYIEGNWYFPPTSVQHELLSESPTPYTCPWKGKCQYYTVTVDGQANADAAWSYPEPLPTAIERVHKDFSGYIAFWRGVEVSGE
ncbi:MAG: DUF427 domain-containing protein [Candidatus Saccharimonadales bacterium]|nr:DUF427 domain-containing protein [Candidatus Saccharibacteria bacterium]